MDLKVVDTEPTVQKATASAVMKAANSRRTYDQVPPFVNTGDTSKWIPRKHATSSACSRTGALLSWMC